MQVKQKKKSALVLPSALLIFFYFILNGNQIIPWLILCKESVQIEGFQIGLYHYSRSVGSKRSSFDAGGRVVFNTFFPIFL